jgi:hypothetical protein
MFYYSFSSVQLGTTQLQISSQQGQYEGQRVSIDIRNRQGTRV